MGELTGRETILVVDDEAIVLSLTSMMLRRYGYEVIAAASPIDALHIVSGEPRIRIDIALLDIIIPGMNGVALASRLREIRPELPIVFMSGYSEEDLLKTISSQEIPYLPKPFTSLQLTRRVREVLDRENSRSRSPVSE